MAKIEIPGRPPLVVRWCCRRCGHQGGVARTTLPIPIDQSWPEPLMRELFDQLRLKLIKVHMRQQACIPVADDFTIERATMDDANLVGLV